MSWKSWPNCLKLGVENDAGPVTARIPTALSAKLVKRRFEVFCYQDTEELPSDLRVDLVNGGCPHSNPTIKETSGLHQT
jgi:hypothetical protein